ncbi:hypothetical protein Q7P37_003204 [Cladosporium fusiforme]
MATPFPRVPRPIAQQLLAEFAPRAPRPGTLHFCANARGRSGSFPGRGDIKDHPHKPPSHEGILEKFQPDTRSASPISLPPHDLMEPCYNAYQPAEQLALFLNPTLYLPNLAPSLRELRSDLAHIRKALEHPEPAAEAYYWTDEVDESSIAHFRGRHMILEETVFWSEIAMLRRRDIFQVQTRVRAIERWLDNVERDCAAARLTPALVAPPSAEFPGGGCCLRDSLGRRSGSRTRYRLGMLRISLCRTKVMRKKIGMSG